MKTSDMLNTAARHANRAQFAPVCGVQIYEQMAIRNTLGNYHLLLAHDILARTERYQAVFQGLAQRSPHRTVILDNSLVELKDAMVNEKEIAQCALAVAANVIVLPDVYRDGEATVEAVRSNYGKWRDTMDNVLGEDNYTFMVVPQGRTLKEFWLCAERIGHPNKVQWWGVPRNMVEHVGSRREPLRIVDAINPNHDIHMLGFSDDFIDDILLARNSPCVRGIDSAVPLRVPTHFHLAMDVEPRPQGWLENAQWTSTMQGNINYVQALL
jgi:hypothetical protein